MTASQRLKKTPLGNIVRSSPRSGDSVHYAKNNAALPLFKPAELRDALRYYQFGSQARACGTGLGTPAVLASVPSTSGQVGDTVMAVLGGESTCHSPRCAKCRNSVMSRRAQEIQFCIDKWRQTSSSAQVSMITLTVPHTWGDMLSQVLGSTKSRVGIRGALALLKQLRLWRNTVKHFVSGLEITHGRNGWHCHFHILIFHDSKLFKSKWHDAWLDASTRAGLPAPSVRRGVVIQRAENAARYMAKWSIASEAAGGNRKFAKHGNRSIFQLETAVASGDKRSIDILIEYNFQTLRAKWHNFSKGLKSWRSEYRMLRNESKPLFAFDQCASSELLQNDDLRQLVVELAGQDISCVSDIGTALGLGGEVPKEPEIFFIVEPYKRVKRQYERAISESRWEDAEKLWVLVEHYERSSYQGPAKDAAVQLEKTSSAGRLTYLRGASGYALQVEQSYWNLLAKHNEREDIL